MERVYVVKIVSEKKVLSKNLKAFAVEKDANDFADTMNKKNFPELRYVVDDVRFQDETISEDDF